jgi:hypothetical protein
MWKYLAGMLKEPGWTGPSEGARLAPEATAPPAAAPQAAPFETWEQIQARHATPVPGGSRDPLSAGPGFSDPTLAAHAQIARMFEVVAPGFQGERLPNQVTQEELDRVGRIYQGISSGSSNIQIDASRVQDWHTADFKKSVMEDLAAMLQTPMGRTLLEQLHGAKAPDGSARTTTISGVPLAELGTPILSNELPEVRAADPSRDAQRYDGTGTDMSVGHWADNMAIPGRGPTVRTDVTLFRELLRGLHGVTGTTQRGLMAQEELLPGDEGAHLDRQDYAEVGLGPFAAAGLSENAYRRARQQLARQKGKIEGDEDFDMRPRESFLGKR